MDVVYLTVPFKDKDIVKALGARWDGKNRKWFAPQGTETRFSRWIKGDDIVEAPTPVSETGGWVGAVDAALPSARVGASLSSVLFEASEAIRKALPVPRWLVAEVASIRKHAHSGHSYMELVEHDDMGREMAKANARIWSGSSKILKRFEKETGGPIVEGMKVLLLAQADFSIQYGFGLTVEDIDPAWTLGEMQRKLRDIRERLTQEGVLSLNSKRPPALDFQRVALIAPDGAAGLGDFMADAHVLTKAGLCTFELIPAVFEGASAGVSLSAAMIVAAGMCQESVIDAVVIVRGGGAKTSLNWLNEYHLAKLICLMPAPVMVGVGHERDSTMLDEVCCESFDTPSKVIGAITSRIISNAKGAMLALSQIKASAASVCSRAHRESLSHRHAVESEAKSVVSRESQLIQARMTETKSRSASMMSATRAEVEAMAREVIGLGPSAVMTRGYAVVEQEGKTCGRVRSIDASKPVTLRMSDGDTVVFLQNEGKI